MSAPELPNLLPSIRRHLLRRAAVERGIVEACVWHHARGWLDGHNAGLRAQHFADADAALAWLAFGVYRWRASAVLFRGLRRSTNAAGREYLAACAYAAAGRSYDRGRLLAMCRELRELDENWRLFVAYERRAGEMLNRSMANGELQPCSNDREFNSRPATQIPAQPNGGYGVRVGLQSEIQDGAGGGPGGRGFRGLRGVRQAG